MDYKNNLFGRQKYLDKNYNHIQRYVSYGEGILTITSLMDKGKILEIGGGNTFISNHLKENGYDVTRMDLDPSTKPDVVGDIREITNHFLHNSFDIIYAFQVLEHIPFRDVSSTLMSLSMITQRYVVISIPDVRAYFQLLFHLPAFQRFFKKEYLDVTLPIPIQKNKTLDSGHYWELGSQRNKREELEENMDTFFDEVQTFKTQLNQLHRFYILEKK